MPIQQGQEILVIRGRLDRGDRFVPVRCASTFYVREWPEAGDSPYIVELLDSVDRLLNREPALLHEENRCDPGEAPRFRLTAYIALHQEAKTVQLRHDDRVLWQRAIPAPASLEVDLPGEVSRQEPARLHLHMSSREEGAYLQVMYQWGERRFHTVDILEPAEEVEIDMRGRPGGEVCRFVVIYSNGLRSAVAATREFALPPLGPAVTILHPPADAALTTGQPLILEGQVIDAERAGGARLGEDLLWLVDEAPVGRGPMSSVDPLAPGAHRIVLRYEGGQSAEAAVIVTVRRANVATADEWEPWDEWGSDITPSPESSVSRS